MAVRILVGDALAQLRTMPDESVQCCVTSPPYWGLRDYGVDGQIGLESTPDEYVARLVAVFQEVRRVLKKDGTLWLNIADSYCAAPNSNLHAETSTLTTRRDGSRKSDATRVGVPGNKGNRASALHRAPHRQRHTGVKAKDLFLMPFEVASALRADGWYLRWRGVWAKPNGMPSSQTDRPTVNYEDLFIFSKSRRYYYDRFAVTTPFAPSSVARLEQQQGSARANGGGKTNGRMKAVKFGGEKHMGGSGGAASRENTDRPTDQSSPPTAPTAATNGDRAGGGFEVAMLRSVWWIPTEPNKLAHFAIMAKEVARRMILLGSRPGDTVLDPFGGVGTTALVADRHGRDAILIELNPANAEIARARIHEDAPLFNTDGAA